MKPKPSSSINILGIIQQGTHRLRGNSKTQYRSLNVTVREFWLGLEFSMYAENIQLLQIQAEDVWNRQKRSFQIESCFLNCMNTLTQPKQQFGSTFINFYLEMMEITWWLYFCHISYSCSWFCDKYWHPQHCRLMVLRQVYSKWAALFKMLSLFLPYK